jgi:hypothetical protein
MRKTQEMGDSGKTVRQASHRIGIFHFYTAKKD